MNYILEHINAYQKMFNYSDICTKWEYTRFILLQFITNLVFFIFLPIIAWFLIQTSAFSLQLGNIIKKVNEWHQYGDFMLVITFTLLLLLLIVLPIILSYMAITARRMNHLNVPKKWLFLIMPMSLIFTPVIIIFTIFLMVKENP